MDFPQLLIFLMFARVMVIEFEPVGGLQLQGLSSLSRGDSLAVEKENDILISPNGTFSCGFYMVGTNAFCFSIWFTNSAEKTVVWMANRDEPVNGKRSRLSLNPNGNLILTNHDGTVVWSTGTSSEGSSEVWLRETGNLVVINQAGLVLWQSFDSPTDTVLAYQPITKNTTLVSMRSRETHLSGFYNFKFDDNNVLDLIFNSPQISSVYWPPSGTSIFDYGRNPYNSSRTAVFDEKGSFGSTDNWYFNASDYGIGPKRRLTLDYDGVLRLYSLEESTGNWSITYITYWLDGCKVNGLCGEYGVCTYNLHATCSCPNGFVRNDLSDWKKGCAPAFNMTCNETKVEFIKLPFTDYYGYDLSTYGAGVSFETCRNACLTDCQCKGFAYSWDGNRQCYPKGRLLNGYQMPSGRVSMYLKVPKSIAAQGGLQPSGLQCSDAEVVLGNNDSTQDQTDKNWYMKYLIGFLACLGAIEIVCIGLVWLFVFKKNVHEELATQGYMVLAMAFRRFTYSELKKATNSFKQEIGKGGFGTVYKGVLDGGRIVAVKRLEGILQGNSEFWAEVDIIGRINHRNLVKLLGFCDENEQKLLVYEYMENGSLDQILFSSDNSSRTLTWDQRYDIAIGTARGLSYLHEECLEWVLHCDVKPQNILLDGQFEPKVADFGMSKLFKDGIDMGFSRVRGTRGYLAPEWMMNLKIDAKADVYSYGIVLLELVTGKSASNFQLSLVQEDKTNEFSNLVEWAYHNLSQNGLEAVIDPRLGDQYDKEKVDSLVKVALLCSAEDRDKRPAMSSVVELLLGNDQSNTDEYYGD